MNDYLAKSRDLTNSLLLVIPVLVLYEAGLLLTRFEVLNGVDFLTIFLLRYFGLKGLLLFNLVLLATLIVATHLRQQRETFDTGLYPAVTAESLLYAVALGAGLTFVLQKLPLAAATGFGPVTAVVLSLGAGVNEELVFRLVLFGGGTFFLAEVLGFERRTAVVLAALASSLMFSLAHYGAGGEVFQLASFTYRALAGLLFCGLYAMRGFAVAVYTHALYDILVLVPPSL